MNDDIDEKSLLLEARGLYQAYLFCDDEERAKQITQLIHQALTPLLVQDNPSAVYLIWQLSLDEQEEDRLTALRRFADSGSAEAQYALAFELFTEPATVSESNYYYQQAAEQGHLGARFCYGMNLLTGDGVSRDSELGLSQIKRAADAKFGSAIRFIAEAHYFGLHGYPKNEVIAARWYKKLEDPDVLS